MYVNPSPSFFLSPLSLSFSLSFCLSVPLSLFLYVYGGVIYYSDLLAVVQLVHQDLFTNGESKNPVFSCSVDEAGCCNKSLVYIRILKM